jgi:copper homeostasis protein
MAEKILLEVCVDSVASAVASETGGAHRVELCSELSVGGLTPSAGLMATVRQRIKISLHILIRPRAGDFCYDADEFAAMKKDIALAKQFGVNGVALGVLLPDLRIDRDRTQELVHLARPLEVTFNRAFDLVADGSAALEAVAATGATRILTSGGAPSATQGSENIGRLVTAAGTRIGILACGGIREWNVADLLQKTRVRELHANLATPQEPENTKVSPALLALGTRPPVVQAETVARLLRASNHDRA